MEDPKADASDQSDSIAGETNTIPRKRQRLSEPSPQDSVSEASFVRITPRSSGSETGGQVDLDNGFITLTEQCYEIQRSRFHFPNLQDFVQRLDDACKARWNTRRQAPHRQVSALLLSWEDDDLGVKAEIDDLYHVFRDSYRFQVDRWCIPSRKQRYQDIVNRIAAFLEPTDKKREPVDCEGNLFIIYYGGHAYQDGQGQPIWVS